MKLKAQKAILKNTSQLLVLAFIFTFTLGSLLTYFNPLNIKPAYADSISELQKKSNQLQAEIAANNAKIHELEEKAQTLQGRIDQLSAEITQANNEIRLTTIKLEELKLKLDQTINELERQKKLLKAALIALYERKGASTVELIMASDSFSQFISSQEYLERLQTAVKESTEKVVKLKHEIEAQKQAQADLLKRQEDQRNVLSGKKKEQSDLLAQTRGEEARYQAIVDSQRKALQEAEDRLSALLISGTYVSLGPVARGQIIGQVASTGFSTGPHLHFQVTQNGVSRNPRAGGNSLINGYSWPLPSSGWGNISQSWGCVAPAGFYYTSCNGGRNSFHSGLDISGWYGDPVTAAADGNIIYKSCNGGYGFTIIIDHGGGWQTWYPHMRAPSGKTSGYC